jgi:hypothetical protein
MNRVILYPVGYSDIDGIWYGENSVKHFKVNMGKRYTRYIDFKIYCINLRVMYNGK